VLVAVTLVGTGALAIAAPATAADPCGTGSNPIVCENSKPGTDPSVWDISGAGDSQLQGFATDISVNVGGTIGFKINTTSSAYTIDIYRSGYYGGLGARKIASVTPSAQRPQTQPQCVWDVTTELTDCGNWAVSASWTVPTDAVSGVYFAKLTDAAKGWDSHITFVVRNDASHSDIIYQTSDPTWEAYNTYGGSDFYQGAANGRSYKVSYNRPMVTRDNWSGRDFYFSNEYPMVRFLERNGYDVSYLAGVDSDRNGALLKNHKVFLSVGHDEYWSTGQRANVQAARDAGVNLAFFSGNEVYWHTRYEPSVAGTPTDYRTLVTYKETWANAKIDPSPTWTGTWRDPRFASAAQGAGLPENGLTGTLYMSNNSDLPITVTAAQGKTRLWRNTTLTSMAAGTTQALAAHTVGYESDEDLDNGFRPAGLVDLSTTVGAVPQYLQDFGNVVQPGTTTHHVTLYKAASGALVFSAGTIQWAWGLDQTHDGAGAPADPRMQQATINLLADMGAQPLTLMSGMVAAAKSTDVTAPTVTITSPASGAALANGTSITATGTASDVGGQVAGVEVSTDGGATWHPATGTTNWSYTYVQSGLGAGTIQARATDDSANIGTPVSQPVTVSCPCSVYGSTTPATPAVTDATASELGLQFTTSTAGFVTGVRFYKGTGNTGTHVGSLWTSAGQRLASVTFTNESASGWQQANFSLPVAVSPGSTYVVSYTDPAGHYAAQSEAFAYSGLSAPPLAVAGGFGVASGGVFGTPGAFPSQTFGASQYYVDAVFQTADTTPLSVGAQSPLPGSTSVPTGTPIQATFSKAVTASTVSIAVAAGSTPIAGTTSYNTTSRVATFTPSAALPVATTLTVTVSASSSTGGVTSGSPWTFTTAAADQTAGSLPVSFYNDSATPTTLEAADYTGVTLGVRFASGTAGVITGVRFYKGPNNTGTHVGALWLAGGSTPLASATFTGESTQGWQTVTFATPVHIAANTEYVASYRTSVGAYAASVGAFSGAGLQRAPLRTTTDSGMYSYPDAYPGGTSSTSYMVDVLFVPDAPALSVVTQTPAPGDPGTPVGSPVSLTMSVPLAAGAKLSLSGPSGAVAGTSALSADGLTLTFTPSAPLTASTAYTATATKLVSTAGVTSSDVTWSFTTASSSGCPCTLFGAVAPAITSANDSSGVELGVAFTPSQYGVITGIRFYKGAGNGGTHTGTLWSSTGTALATVTFSGESASGWQTATLATPYAVAPGTTYVVSYFAPQGHYALTQNAFGADVVNGQLTAPAAGNGRFQYGGGFPTGTWQQSNYFVDVVFLPQAPPPPTVTSTQPASGATGVSINTPITATLSSAPASGTPTLALSGPSGAIAGVTAYDAPSRTVSFTPSAALSTQTGYTATVTLSGNPLTGGTWSFTTAAAGASTVSLWSSTDVPVNPSWNDTASVQVGTRFTTSAAGTVTAIKFYKGAANTGAHTVELWDPNGNLLASAPSTGESASGWQTVSLPTPVTLTPGVIYTAAYESVGGEYAVSSGGLATVRTVGPLSTVANGGAYVYGDGSAYPSGSSSAWYGVDLVFTPAG
jgi:hypothetical protein